MATIRALQQVRAGVVSLPMCNLYLQDRAQSASQRWVNLSESLPEAIATTPRWRGVTLLHELKHQGIPVALASDNCRDVFHSFGDHDVLEVFSQSVKIAHLDRPYGDWPQAVTKTAADLMGLSQVGRIAPVRLIPASACARKALQAGRGIWRRCAGRSARRSPSGC